MIVLQMYNGGKIVNLKQSLRIFFQICNFMDIIEREESNFIRFIKVFSEVFFDVCMFIWIVYKLGDDVIRELSNILLGEIMVLCWF